MMAVEFDSVWRAGEFVLVVSFATPSKPTSTSRLDLNVANVGFIVYLIMVSVFCLFFYRSWRGPTL
jgi:hypothetical protein